MPQSHLFSVLPNKKAMDIYLYWENNHLYNMGALPGVWGFRENLAIYFQGFWEKGHLYIFRDLGGKQTLFGVLTKEQGAGKTF